LDLVYRTLCSICFNFVPTSGHPGGSISSGRIVEGLLFRFMDYNLADPDEETADYLSYSAGHKVLGLYVMWALRNEVARIAAPELLAETRFQLRMEDLLGFRRNPTQGTPLFRSLGVRALDGHPTPATPFVRLATGASGVGVAASIGYAMGALDCYRDDPPRVHVLEGEGGMTPGRVQESLASAGTMGINNVIMHVDFNQASIESDLVCRDGDMPGDYVQWTPAEIGYLNDWNVIEVADGMDFRQVFAAQEQALAMDNGQPTMVVYPTVKGWKYGIEGRASHGAGHGFCSEGYYQSLEEFEREFEQDIPHFAGDGKDEEAVEKSYYDSLMTVRGVLEAQPELCRYFAGRIAQARERLTKRARKLHAKAPRVEALFEGGDAASTIPEELRLEPGSSTSLRAAMGKVMGYLNRRSGGALFAASADLHGSTNVRSYSEGFSDGFYNSRLNPDSRLLSNGGICEDAMSGMLAGISSFGRHMGSGSSYGAFIASLGHIAARMHGIANQARQNLLPEPYRTYICVCAHAGIETGEDGPSHADPQALQLLQGNFPTGVMITLTPWDPHEIWPLLNAGLAARPAILAPFVTRPSLPVLDRDAYGLSPAEDCVTGLRICYGRPAGARQARRQPRRVLREQRRSLRPPAGRAAPDPVPRRAGSRGHGDNRFHHAHAVSLGHVGVRPRLLHPPLQAGILPGQRPGSQGVGRGRPRRSLTAQSRTEVRRGTRR